MKNIKAIIAWIIRELGFSSSDLLNNTSIRLLIQKVAYIMRAKGLIKLDYMLHIQGPYSSQLASIYMSLAMDGNENILSLAERYKPSEEEEFIMSTIKNILSKHGLDEGGKILEVATTIFDIYEYNKPEYNMKKAIEHTVWLKPWAEKYIEEAIKLLRELGLIKEKEN